MDPLNPQTLAGKIVLAAIKAAITAAAAGLVTSGLLQKSEVTTDVGYCMGLISATLEVLRNMRLHASQQAAELARLQAEDAARKATNQ